MSNVVDTAIEFIESINRRRWERLAALMADDFRMVSPDGVVTEGP
ncbi:MAG: hypothetical protein ABIE70_07910 [bacterium]